MDPNANPNANRASEDESQEESSHQEDAQHDLPEQRYRYKDGRYYFDRRPTDAPGSFDEALNYEAKWEPGFHSEQYVMERDRVLREASCQQTSDAGERDRIQVANKKTFPHYYQGLPGKFDPAPKPLFETESPHELEGRIYLRRHKILEMFQNMTTLMLVQKPGSPKNFMINHLQSLISVRESYPSVFDIHRAPNSSSTVSSSSTSGGESSSSVDAAVEEADARLPRVFSEDNIKTTFSLLEPTGKKTTTSSKAKHAFKILGLDDYLKEEDGVEFELEEASFVSKANKCAIAQAKTFFPRIMWEKDEAPTFETLIA